MRGRNCMKTAGSGVGRPSLGSRAWRWRMAAPASAAPIACSATSSGVSGRCGLIVGVWIDPVTAQVMMTFPDCGHACLLASATVVARLAVKGRARPRSRSGDRVSPCAADEVADLGVDLAAPAAAVEDAVMADLRLHVAQLLAGGEAGAADRARRRSGRRRRCRRSRPRWSRSAVRRDRARARPGGRGSRICRAAAPGPGTRA